MQITYFGCPQSIKKNLCKTTILWQQLVFYETMCLYEENQHMFYMKKNKNKTKDNTRTMSLKGK